jgi:hypothetical protein
VIGGVRTFEEYAAKRRSDVLAVPGAAATIFNAYCGITGREPPPPTMYTPGPFGSYPSAFASRKSRSHRPQVEPNGPNRRLSLQFHIFAVAVGVVILFPYIPAPLLAGRFRTAALCTALEAAVSWLLYRELRPKRSHDNTE